MVDCCTELLVCKDNAEFIYMDVFAAIYFCEFLFLSKIAKINHS